MFQNTPLSGKSVDYSFLLAVLRVFVCVMGSLTSLCSAEQNEAHRVLTLWRGRCHVRAATQRLLPAASLPFLAAVAMACS